MLRIDLLDAGGEGLDRLLHHPGRQLRLEAERHPEHDRLRTQVQAQHLAHDGDLGLGLQHLAHRLDQPRHGGFAGDQAAGLSLARNRATAASSTPIRIEAAPSAHQMCSAAAPKMPAAAMPSPTNAPKSSSSEGEQAGVLGETQEAPHGDATVSVRDDAAELAVADQERRAPRTRPRRPAPRNSPTDGRWARGA